MWGYVTLIRSTKLIFHILKEKINKLQILQFVTAIDSSKYQRKIGHLYFHNEKLEIHVAS